jgi:anti-sigma regulatory factor (Ser/Thr protein kinase)
MLKCLTVNTTSDNNLGPQIQSVISLFQEIENSKEEITLDFSNYKWSPPVLSVLISSYIMSNNIAYKNCEASYLNTISFPIGMTSNISELSEYKDKSYLPIIKFNTSKNEDVTIERSDVIGLVGKMIKDIVGLPSNYYSAIAYIISEITDNIIDHSNSSYGWLSFQNYPNKGYLDLCIADSGIGLLNSYQNYKGEKEYSQIITHSQAIQEAVSGSSTKNLKERGYGLPTSKKMIIEGLKGKFVYCSGKALLHNNEVIDISYDYQGTFLILRIPCNNLDNSFNITNYLE